MKAKSFTFTIHNLEKINFTENFNNELKYMKYFNI